MQPAEALRYLSESAAKLVSHDELQAKLAEGRALRVKLGVDPTSPDIHLGHTVVLNVLRRFQERGHQAILIIGDFTAMIGDPSGRSATRPHLSRDEILYNAETYRNQAFKILDPEKTETYFNGEWFESMTFEQIIGLTSQITLQQILQREDFKKRLHEAHPIHGHEILYPIMQGYDSVRVKADVELGGTDQLFNCLVGRDFQKHEGQSPQVVLVMPILEGLDGSMKMSKSLGNYVGLTDPASEMFGKLMSISDRLMARYYPLLLEQELDPNLPPLKAKKDLAFAIVAKYHSLPAANIALQDWITRVSKKSLEDAELPYYFRPDNYTSFVDLVGHVFQNTFGIKKSRSDIRRLIEQESVQIDGKKITDMNAQVRLHAGQILRLDKKHAVRIRE